MQWQHQHRWLMRKWQWAKGGRVWWQQQQQQRGTEMQQQEQQCLVPPLGGVGPLLQPMGLLLPPRPGLHQAFGHASHFWVTCAWPHWFAPPTCRGGGGGTSVACMQRGSAPCSGPRPHQNLRLGPPLHLGCALGAHRHCPNPRL